MHTLPKNQDSRLNVIPVSQADVAGRVAHLQRLPYNAAAFVCRYDSDCRIWGAVSGALRVRTGDVDHLFYVPVDTLLQQGVTPHEEHILHATITGDATKDRQPVFFVADSDSCQMYEELTPGGAWGVVMMSRMQTKPKFHTQEYLLDERWFMRDQPTFRMDHDHSTLALSTDPRAVQWAREYPTAMFLMHAAASLVGGINGDSLPALQLPTIDALKTAVDYELAHRSGGRRSADQLAHAEMRALETLRRVREATAGLSEADRQRLDQLKASMSGAGAVTTTAP